MKKLSLAFVAVLLLSVNAFAITPNSNVPKPLSSQIQTMLANSGIALDKDLTGQVRFTVNQEGQIVVLSIDTESKALEGFVKNRLNYKKLNLSKIEEGKLYTVPVRITA